MRGRILLAAILCLATVTACSRKESIYIEPGKQENSRSTSAGPSREPERSPPPAQTPQAQTPQAQTPPAETPPPKP